MAATRKNFKKKKVKMPKKEPGPVEDKAKETKKKSMKMEKGFKDAGSKKEKAAGKISKLLKKGRETAKKEPGPVEDKAKEIKKKSMKMEKGFKDAGSKKEKIAGKISKLLKKGRETAKKEPGPVEKSTKIKKDFEVGKIKNVHVQILKQRGEAQKLITKSRHLEKHTKKEFVKTGIQGFDALMERGIPKGSAVLLCGGPGSGKSIMSLQILNNAAIKGKKCIYMTFEENEDRLRQHMEDFGWNPDKLENEGNLVIKRYDPFAITRSVEALLEKAKGELMIDVSPVLFPEGFKPDWVVIDSVTAIASAFYGREETYRIYIEQLFRLLEHINATSFLITESNQIPIKITESGVEEFLADGVIILYNIKSGNVRESALEILKMRGIGFQKKIVAMKIESGKGITVYPEQEVFGGS